MMSATCPIRLAWLRLKGDSCSCMPALVVLTSRSQSRSFKPSLRICSIIQFGKTGFISSTKEWARDGVRFQILIDLAFALASPASKALADPPAPSSTISRSSGSTSFSLRDLKKPAKSVLVPRRLPFWLTMVLTAPMVSARGSRELR